MIILGGIKGAGGKNGGGNGLIGELDPCCFQRCLGRLPLLGCGHKNSAGVLLPPITKLAAVIKGINVAPKHLQQILQGKNPAVKGHLHHLPMPRVAGRHLVIAGAGHMAAAIAADRLLHPLQLFQVVFQTPEASPRQHDCFPCPWGLPRGCAGFLQWCSQDGATRQEPQTEARAKQPGEGVVHGHDVREEDGVDVGPWFRGRASRMACAARRVAPGAPSLLRRRP